MRHFVAVPIVALLLAAACDSGKEAETKPEAEPNPKTAAKTDAKAAPEQGKAAEPDAKAEPAPEPEPTPEPEPKPDDFGAEFCATIIPCYQKLEFAGSFTADVTVDIEPDGSVSSVSFTGEAPKPVQTCITDAIEAITLEGYNGKPGRTRCKKSGQLMGGTQMIMSDREYEVRDAGDAPTEPEGKDESKGEAKAKKKSKKD